MPELHVLDSLRMRIVAASGRMPDGPAKQLAGKIIGRLWHVSRAVAAGNFTLARNQAEHVVALLRAFRSIQA
jgi:hypothetical protein